MATTTERSSISPMTSTSHTMTAFPPPVANGHSIHPTSAPQNLNLNPYEALIASLQPENRYSFLTPATVPNESAVKCAKILLDGFASKIYEEQKIRLEAEKQGKKRKRGDDVVEGRDVLKIRKIVTEGFGTNHVWEQTRRVVDALRGEVERTVEELKVEDEEEEEHGSGFHTEEEDAFDEDGFGIEDEEESGDEDMEGEEEEEDSDEEMLDEDQMAALEAIEAGSDVDEDEDESEDEDQDDEDRPADVYEPDTHGLNDGFFSIDDFNKQTEFLEQQDALADPFTGEASDEEEIDWDADPTATIQPSTSSSSRKKAMDIDEEAEESEEEEEDGPTFGNADLNAPFSDDDSDQEEDPEAAMDEDPTANTNEILYADFFEPPPKKASKADRQTAYLSRQAAKSKTTEKEAATSFEAELERAQASQRRDLFDDESVPSDSEASDLDPGDPKSRKSAHERRQAKLAAEIHKLEAASVQKRDWTLAGEAKASDRSKNSLTFLEEELDFERTGKPVPVITAEVSESIEELIKRRILAKEFDEVIKRRPDSLLNEKNVRRGAFELSDEKSAKGLGEMYAEDHVKATVEGEGEVYVSAGDEKLQGQREEIKGLWKEVEGRLDALSSWHYRPRPAAPGITVVADVATVQMEDAQPSTGGGIGGGAASMLAPQEIYKAGQDLDAAAAAMANGDGGEEGGMERNREVIRGGVPVAREEMSRDEKKRRRRGAKERIRKRGGEEVTKGGRAESKKTKEKKEVVGALKKGGVMVINRKGEVRDMEGNKAVKKGVLGSGGGGFKL